MKKLGKLIFVLALWMSTTAMAATTLTNLRTESLKTPIGIDELQPLFSWQMTSNQIGSAQRAYRVMVALDPTKLETGDLVYDSGRIMSDESIGGSKA
jgi:alpha-L-rhamnosidase